MNLVIILNKLKELHSHVASALLVKQLFHRSENKIMQIHYLREEDYPYIKPKIRLSLSNAKIII